QTMTKEALLASQAAICVAQFMKQPNPEAKLKELEAVSSWQRAEVIEKGAWDKMPGQEKAGYAVPRSSAQRAEVIEKGGWDKMPGQEKAGYAVARACADGLELLFKK